MSVFIILFFLIIFFIYILKKKENFVNYECPYSLIQISNKILAYYNEKDNLDKNKKNMEGINPIVFNSLDEYKKYMDFQNNKGVYCPILNINNKNIIYPIEKALRLGNIGKPTENIKKLVMLNFVNDNTP